MSKQNFILQKLHDIEVELLKLHVDVDIPSAQAFNYKMPFAIDTMSLEQWLYFIYIPKIRESVNNNDFSLLTNLVDFSFVFQHHLTADKYAPLVKSIEIYEKEVLKFL